MNTDVFHEHRWTSLDIEEHLWTSMNIHDHLWICKNGFCCNHRWCGKEPPKLAVASTIAVRKWSWLATMSPEETGCQPMRSVPRLTWKYAKPTKSITGNHVTSRIILPFFRLCWFHSTCRILEHYSWRNSLYVSWKQNPFHCGQLCSEKWQKLLGCALEEVILQFFLLESYKLNVEEKTAVSV